MSQKTNPISLRLQKSNKTFSSCWYSDFFYDQKMYHDFKIRSYIETVAEQVGDLQMLSYLQIHYKRSYMHLFLSDMRGIREEREKSLKISRKNTQFFEQKIKMPLLSFLYHSKNKIKDNAAQGGSTQDEVARLIAITFAHSIFMYQSARKKVNPLIGTKECTTYLQNKHTATRPVSSTSRASDQHLCAMETCLASKHSKGEDLLALPLSPFLINNKNKISNSDRLNFDLQEKSKSTFQDKTSVDLVFSKNKEYNKEYNYGLYLLLLGHACWKDTTFLNKSKYRVNGELNGELSENQNNKFTSARIVNLLAYLSRITTQEYKAQNRSQVIANPLENSEALYLQEKGLVKKASTKEKKVLLASFSFSRELQVQPGKPVTPRLQSELQFNHFFGINPIRVVQDAQSAVFLAKEIVYFIQKGVSFRLIKDQILRDLTKNVNIKGVRFSCSGRIGGRSKKAQKTKKQSIQWGETSLHLFSSKLSFAKASASTPFGKIGVKVWLSYK